MDTGQVKGAVGCVLQTPYPELPQKPEPSTQNSLVPNSRVLVARSRVRHGTASPQWLWVFTTLETPCPSYPGSWKP